MIKKQQLYYGKHARIYHVNQHGITRDMIDFEALRICDRLLSKGYQAFIVGGAIRDLLLGIKPKDFDIVTNAHPKQARRVCGYSRIIGRRFPLLHVISPSQRIFEVASFRKLHASNNDDDLYGSIDEDAYRRDFTLNALYYDPVNQHLIDYHHGFDHIKQHKVVLIGSAHKSFHEDPVRMLRGVKYATTTTSRIGWWLGYQIKHHAHLLTTCSKSRMAEELNKILEHSKCAIILQACYRLHLLQAWLPQMAQYITQLPLSEQHNYWQSIQSLEIVQPQHKKSFYIMALVEPYLLQQNALKNRQADLAIDSIKQFLLPMVLPNAIIIKATRLLFNKHKLHWYAEIEIDSVATTLDQKRSRRRPWKQKTTSPSIP
jgi:poly(A) polymerase